MERLIPAQWSLTFTPSAMTFISATGLNKNQMMRWWDENSAVWCGVLCDIDVVSFSSSCSARGVCNNNDSSCCIIIIVIISRIIIFLIHISLRVELSSYLNYLSSSWVYTAEILYLTPPAHHTSSFSAHSSWFALRAVDNDGGLETASTQWLARQVSQRNGVI